MKRILLAAALLLLPRFALAQTEVQALVDRSTLALQEMMDPNVSSDAHAMLRRARAVLICPRIFKAGFLFAGAGGDCVMAARAANGTWSYPAFFTIGSISVGFQIGLQDSQLVMMVLTQRGLNALLSNHFKFGGDASIAVATIGGGVQGSTTTAVGADIVAFTKARGAFAGVSLDGSLLSSRQAWDQAYYGQPLGSRQIVVQMQGRNQGADPLRELLTRYGASAPTQAAYPAQAAHPPAASQPYPAAPQAGIPTASAANATQPIPLQPGGGVEQHTLPAPTR